MTLHIDLAKAKELISQAVAERGEAADYLSFFQGKQDFGTPWGACRAYADRMISE